MVSRNSIILEVWPIIMLQLTAFIKRRWDYLALALILGLALYLRLSHLGSVQRWTGDQSSFYQVIMNWFQDGNMPLLGPYRSISGDHGIGPGWYFTLAPALWLTHYSLAAGAATVVLFGIAAIFLSWFWMLRTTGSRLAALATAAIFAFSAPWIFNDRLLWNPSVMPFSVIAMACIIDLLARRPVPGLALFIMLAGVLPQWHSTGIPIFMASLPVAAWALARGWGRFRDASRREWIGWGLALLVVLTILYLPPLIFELRPGPGNLATYFKNTMLPKPPQALPLSQRALGATWRMISLAVNQTFFLHPQPSQAVPSRILAALAALAFLIVGGRAWLKGWRTAPLSILFLVFILAGHWLLVVLNGASVADYYLLPALAVPVLLSGWTAGQLLGMECGRPLCAHFSRGAGLLAVVLGLTVLATQFPTAWGIHKGRVSYAYMLHDSEKIAKYIIKDAAGKKVSMLYSDAVGNSTAFMHILLRAKGLRTTNGDMSLRRPSIRRALGEQLYLIVRGKLNQAPQFEGVAIKLQKPAHIADAWVYRIPVSELPANAQSVFLYAKAPQWVLQINTK